MKTINTILILIFSLTLVSALTIDAGSCESIEIETTNNIFWTVSGNSSSIDGINITQEGNNITICLDVMFQEDSFNILFIEEQTKEVIKEVNVGGGSGGTRTIYKNKTIEVPTYVDREVIKEVTNEVEVPGENIETTKIPLWIWLVFVVLAGLIINLIRTHSKKDKRENTDERRYEDNERKEETKEE